MSLTENGNPPSLIAERISSRMQFRQLSIRDLASKADVTYEQIRKVVRGLTLPSESLLAALSDILGLPLEEMERLAIADRIRAKYGTIPLELSGKNPELEPIERAWRRLTLQHKNDLVAIANSLADQDSAMTDTSEPTSEKPSADGPRPDYNKLREWLLLKLQTIGVSVENFAAICGMSRGTIYQWFVDKNRPSEEQISAVCRVLNVPVEEGRCQYMARPSGRPKN